MKQDDNTVQVVDDAEIALTTQTIHNIENYDFRNHNKPLYADNVQGLEDFKEKTLQYFNEVRAVNSSLEADQKPLIVSIESWCCYMGFTRALLTKYRHRGQDWQDFIDYIKECILSHKLQRAMTGKTPAVLALFDLTNNHHYYSTSEFHKGGTDGNMIAPSAVVYPKLVDISNSQGIESHKI